MTLFRDTVAPADWTKTGQWAGSELGHRRGHELSPTPPRIFRGSKLGESPAQDLTGGSQPQHGTRANHPNIPVIQIKVQSDQVVLMNFLWLPPSEGFFSSSSCVSERPPT